LTATDALILKPITGFKGQVKLPGSKSLSNRILLLAAMSQGETFVSNLLMSDDTEHMLKALGQLGVHVDLDRERCTAKVQGLGKSFPKPQLASDNLDLFLGNAGTAMRPLCAALALSGAGPFTLSGEPRMYERPIGPLVTALAMAGAEVSYQGEDGYPPISINKFKASSDSDE
jgi:3-phosphoshikimate 1-carboxyvinyltransferase